MRDEVLKETEFVDLDQFDDSDWNKIHLENGSISYSSKKFFLEKKLVWRYFTSVPKNSEELELSWASETRTRFLFISFNTP